MAQITHGLRGILSHPALYNLMQNLVGAEKARRILVREFFPQRSGMRMLDIGCGTAEILRHLPADTRYSGFDASEPYIDYARQHFGSRGSFRAELVERATLSELGRFDLVLAFGLLHHLDDDAAAALFGLAAEALDQGGKLVTIDPTYVDGQHPLARWMIGKDRGQNIRTPDEYAALARRHFGDVACHVRHDLLYIPYSHTILECRSA
ncbi:MAG TPA: class I SAM-dependent methyltransferase [Mariprofundaceae bacterium]|nr:class I SAM-dependent methyltransferase [Mariprofundaceae bacterium]